MSQIPITTFTQPLAGRQPSELAFDPSVAIAKNIRSSESFLQGQASNLSTSKEAYENASTWDSVNGNKILYKAEYEQETSKYHSLQQIHARLTKAQSQIVELVAQGKTTEATELYRKTVKQYKTQMKIAAGSDTSLSDAWTEQIDNISRSERRTQIVADTTVAAGATVAAIASGGLAGLAIGTATGAGIGAAKNTATALVETQVYDADAQAAITKAAKQTGQDTYTSLKSSIAAATGGAVAKAFATPVTTMAKAGVGAAAGTTATGTSLVINTSERIYLANKSFDEEIGPWTKNMDQEQITRLRKEHYEKHGLDWRTLVKEGAIDLAVGAVSGGQGGVATAAREATKSGVRQAIITSAEVGGAMAIGATASYARHGELNRDTFIEETSGSALATLTGGAVTSKPSKPNPPPVKEPVASTPPAPASHEIVQQAKPAEVKTETKPAITDVEAVKPQETTKPDLHAFSETLAKEGQEQYPAAFEQIRSLLPEDLRSSLIGRPKSESSIESKLHRAKDEWGLKVDSLDDARAAVTDLIGTRLVLKDTSPQNIDRVVAALRQGVEGDQITISTLFNYHGRNIEPYFSGDQIKVLHKAQADKGSEIYIKTEDKAIKKSGYTTTQMGLIHRNELRLEVEITGVVGVRGEFQMRGYKIEKVADVEHLFYDLSVGKGLSHPNPQVKQVLDQLQTATDSLNRQQMSSYQRYITRLFSHARAVEQGKASTMPAFPQDLPQILSFDSLQQIHTAMKHQQH